MVEAVYIQVLPNHDGAQILGTQRSMISIRRSPNKLKGFRFVNVKPGDHKISNKKKPTKRWQVNILDITNKRVWGGVAMKRLERLSPPAKPRDDLVEAKFSRVTKQRRRQREERNEVGRGRNEKITRKWRGVNGQTSRIRDSRVPRLRLD